MILIYPMQPVFKARPVLFQSQMDARSVLPSEASWLYSCLSIALVIRLVIGV